MRPAVLFFLAGASLAETQAAPPLTPEQLFQSAVAAQKQGNDQQAIHDYRALEMLRPDVMEIHANLGVVLTHTGEYEEAIREYALALKLAPANEALKLNLGLSYYKRSQWNSAAEQFAALQEKHPEDSRLATLLADCDVHLGRNEQAISLLRDVDAAHPDDPEVDRVLGTALLHTGHLPEALKLLHNFARVTSNPEGYLLAAQTAMQLNQFEVVKTDVEAAERLRPDLPGLQTLKGQALSYLLDENGATEALRRAVDANPNDFQAQVTLGSLLNGERDPTAEQHLKRAVELDPSSSLARYELGRAQQTNGDFSVAEKNLEQVVHAEPNWLPPHVALAALYARLKKLPEAQHEREIVDRLTAEQQEKERSSATAPPPSH